jgi:hypothetical protein
MMPDLQANFSAIAAAIYRERPSTGFSEGRAVGLAPSLLLVRARPEHGGWSEGPPRTSERPVGR